MDSFFQYLQFEKRYSIHTITSYRSDLTQFSQYLTDTYKIANLLEVDYHIIRSWILALLDEDISAKSINRKVASLRSYYKFHLKGGNIDKDPTFKIKVPKIKKTLPAFIEEENIVKLLDQVVYEENFSGLRDKLIIEFLYGTGVRLSELINIKESDINLFEKTIKVLGKGNKERIIPVNKTLLELIEVYRKTKKVQMLANDYLIITENNEKSYPMFIYRIVKKYLGMIPSEKKSPHVLRHTFATHLLNKGADLNAIKDLLGHSSLAATQIYTHNSIEKLKAIFDQAHPKS